MDQNVISLQNLLGKIHSELWTTKRGRERERARIKKRSCPQPVRSSWSNARIVPGVNLKPLRTIRSGCEQPQHAWLTGVSVAFWTCLKKQRHCDDCSEVWKLCSWSQTANTSKSWTDLGFPSLNITFKAIKLAGVPLSDFSLSHGCWAKFYFYPLVLSDRKYKNQNIYRGLPTVSSLLAWSHTFRDSKGCERNTLLLSCPRQIHDYV